MTCFSRRSWSSVSRMVKFPDSPTWAACRRSMLAHSAWNVPSHNPSAGRPRMAPTRSRISRAALLVKVTASTWFGIGAAGQQDVGEAGGQDTGLAGAGAGQHQQRAVHGFHRFALLGVQAGEVVGHGAGNRAGTVGGYSLDAARRQSWAPAMSSEPKTAVQAVLRPGAVCCLHIRGASPSDTVPYHRGAACAGWDSLSQSKSRDSLQLPGVVRRPCT